MEGAQTLEAYLSLESIEGRMAFGGAHAIEVGTVWLPHLIVLDILMPEIDGFAATSALRLDRRTSSTVILAFTALDEAEVFRHLTYLTFDGCCQKGLFPTVLLALIEHFAR